ncbi:MAG: hypothetical protein PWQ62_758 [Candidatus Methanomethylophilaceae archaeon]|nr:hypothetical protein [Candidatus Methanomethylophilaceae archaeon]
MKLEVEGTEEWGTKAYEELLRRILADMGESRAVEKARIVLRPEEPLFIISIKMRTRPERVNMADIAELRQEGDRVFMRIEDERYAPSILSYLWSHYGRENVDQRTRFELTVRGATTEDLSNIEVVSGEKVRSEMIDAVWRTMPEGMRARYHISGPRTMTILATEEMLLPEMKEEAQRLHAEMEEDSDV